MLMDYCIPLLITFLLASLAVILLYAVPKGTETPVEIIVSGDEKTENIEKTVLCARRIAGRYFKNVSVYIRGGQDAYIDVLCRRYHVQRKE